MSTQEAVTLGAKAAPDTVALALAWWLWLLAALAGALLSWGFGGEPRAVAMAAALAFAPALAGFVLGPRVGRRSADLALIGVWLTAATGLAAGTGGAASPLAAAFAIAPALTLALGRPWAGETGAAAVLGFAAAAGLARLDRGAALGPLPEILTVAALALAAGLMALAHAGARAGARSAVQHVAEVSHELRTPLTHILGFSEMIERRMFGDIADRYVEYAGLIRRSGAQLLGLVNDLLDLGKLDAGRFDLVLEDFDARDIAVEAVRFATDEAAKREIVLGLTTPEAPLRVRADAQALRRMLTNILGNALKFTPAGGQVMVSATALGATLRLEVSDTGPGIAADERARLAEPYRQGRASAEGGAGLGLALVRVLARQHGGALTFHDAPGGGALVRIDLPVLL